MYAALPAARSSGRNTSVLYASLTMSKLAPMNASVQRQRRHERRAQPRGSLEAQQEHAGRGRQQERQHPPAPAPEQRKPPPIQKRRPQKFDVLGEQDQREVPNGLEDRPSGSPSRWPSVLSASELGSADATPRPTHDGHAPGPEPLNPPRAFVGRGGFGCGASIAPLYRQRRPCHFFVGPVGAGTALD